MCLSVYASWLDNNDRNFMRKVLMLPLSDSLEV
jgi:hypothetical protein